jgi:hypothetical protein
VGMGFAGRGNEKHSVGRGNENDRTRNGSREWALRGEGLRKIVRGGGNGNGRTRNDSLPLIALISSRDISK